ncbi:MAG: CDP-diacylglycerol--serine O-phosphatidyltransferase [Phycisphaerales bacterium]|nr:MAG: CDP-diacylglycerol--serine O-phosphatidyltransferase [Phycisphaerales bacterium]
MAKLNTKVAKERLLRRVRRQRLKYIAVFPSLITVLNGVCGFAAIYFASKGAELGAGRFSEDSGMRLLAFGAPSYFAKCCYMILLAMVADMLDGRLARRVSSTSSFGGQLDSLCDIISFGVAPAFLMLKVLQYKLGSAGFANETLVQRFIWLSAAAYISCAAIRLARFNVENEEDESAHMSFVGLPSPAAAGVVVSLVLFHQENVPYSNAIIYVLPFLTLGVGVLMISRVRYPHILNQYLRGKKPFAHFIRVLLFLGLVYWSMQTALVLIFCGFAASSLVKWFYYKVIRKRGHLFLPTQQPALTAPDAADVRRQDQ